MAEYLRRVRRRAQSAIHRYVHPGTGRRVTVVGTHHVGRPAYFACLRAVIDDLEQAGAVVHSEGSSLIPPDEAGITTEEHQLLADLRRLGELEKRRVRELGWIGQIDGLAYPPQWKVTDLSNLDIIRRLGIATVRKKVTAMSRMFDWPDDDHRGLARLQLKVAVGLRLTTSDRGVALASRGPAAKVLVGDRNTVALQAVADSGQDLVLIWGAGHMPGIGAGLHKQGFVRHGQPEWHTILEVPSIARGLWRWVTAGSRSTSGSS